MPAIGPGQTVAPGIVTDPNSAGYPQYGVGGGTPGSSAGWKIVTASNATQKSSYENQGYLVWFSSKSAAQNFISSESSTYGSGSANLIPGLAQIGDFFGTLTQASTWIRIAEVALGAILVAVGVARITHAVPIATKIAKTAGAVAVL